MQKSFDEGICFASVKIPQKDFDKEVNLLKISPFSTSVFKLTLKRRFICTNFYLEIKATNK